LRVGDLSGALLAGCPDKQPLSANLVVLSHRPQSDAVVPAWTVRLRRCAKQAFKLQGSQWSQEFYRHRRNCNGLIELILEHRKGDGINCRNVPSTANQWVDRHSTLLLMIRRWPRACGRFINRLGFCPQTPNLGARFPYLPRKGSHVRIRTIRCCGSELSLFEMSDEWPSLRGIGVRRVWAAFSKPDVEQNDQDAKNEGSCAEECTHDF